MHCKIIVTNSNGKFIHFQNLITYSIAILCHHHHVWFQQMMLSSTSICLTRILKPAEILAHPGMHVCKSTWLPYLALLLLLTSQENHAPDMNKYNYLKQASECYLQQLKPEINQVLIITHQNKSNKINQPQVGIWSTSILLMENFSSSKNVQVYLFKTNISISCNVPEIFQEYLQF